MSVIFLKYCKFSSDIMGSAYKIIQAHFNYPQSLKYSYALLNDKNAEIYLQVERSRQYAYTLLSGIDMSMGVLSSNNNKLARVRNSFL